MNSKYSDLEKQELVDRHCVGEPISDIISDTGIPRSTIYAWTKKTADLDTGKKEVSLKNYRLLENKVVRLQGIIEIMKKVAAPPVTPLR